MFVGFLLALVLLGGSAAAVWLGGDPCLWRCGDGTDCKARVCVAKSQTTPSNPIAGTTPATKRGKRRAPSSGDPARPEVQLQPGDDKMVTQGDALGKSERIDLAAPDAKELSQDDIDATLARGNAAIERCITDALGDVPLESGRVVVGFRIEASGKISRVRTEAPSILQQHGLHRCVKAAVSSWTFPASGGGSVVTTPFEIH